MSVFHRFRHPCEVARHPTLEPEVKRAILASWASDAYAVESQPALRQPPGVDAPVMVNDVLTALYSLDKREKAASDLGR